jgi:hypothetical protein
MSIFGKILGKIFGRDDQPALVTKEGPQRPAAAPQPSAQAQARPAAPAQPAAPTQPVDVEKVLANKAAQNSQKLNWRESIVDLLKLLDLDSSLEARRELAAELGYKGDTSDTATMNVWLINAVMKALEQNGGKVPASLKD